MPTHPARKLETFPNPEPGRDYLIRHECPEYTAVCPVTGQPDFGTIVVLYTPDRLCVELKSLKLYLWSFRDEGHYFEQVTNQILDDLVKAVAPRRMTVIGSFNVRGGITTRVVARHEGPGNAAANRSIEERADRADAAPRPRTGSGNAKRAPSRRA
jgi:7-cyano-7-deazaguanine reductase